ncbi:MAG: SUMF1/EgtB/PvdO family nonheme iron enzyme [Blastocatellia bacterium]|nr:SUMF1/EgtB/PvdO family nonheme iron enzyme [Blastocatellia bacterium]
MFCAACNLHYPDHLNYCRRCGKALVHTVVEAAIESLSCTRCGARVGRGENFCQQCGYRLGVKAAEAVVGACYHCGATWRSDWLFCKTCGLDRDHALLPPISAPASPARLRSQDVKVIETLPRVEKVRCPECEAEAKPYSRYCESCGINLERETTGKLWLVPETSSLPGPEETLSTPDKPDTKEEGGDILNIIPENISSNTSRGVSGDNGDNADNADIGDIGHIGDIGIGIKDADIIDVSHLGIRRPAYQPNSSDGDKESAKPAARETAREDILHDRQQYSLVWLKRVFGLAQQGHGNMWSALRRMSDKINLEPAVLRRISRKIEGRIRSSPVIASLVLGLALLTVLSLFLWLAHNRNGVSVHTAVPSAPASKKSQAAAESSAAGGEDMVYVPLGEFQMGRVRGDLYDSPPLPVIVGPFFIDRTEVTNEKYLKFVKATGHPAPSSWRNGMFKVGEARLPVVNVSWYDAMAYAKWAAKRLPTEAEWEYAARGSGELVYPWGNEWKQGYANADRGKKGRIEEVGRYSQGASPFGVLDMCGNVWELTSGNLVDYSDITKVIHPGRVIRGGAYDVPRTRATTTYRGVVPPDKGFDKTGFRCVRDVIQ